MDYELREHLANEFASVIRSTREEHWESFVKSAQEGKLDPYIGLARTLVRIIEDATEGKPMSMKKKNRKPSAS
jgi:hypothetical protein